MSGVEAAQVTGGESMGHTMMNMVFFTSTSTPLYADNWTPASAGQYAGTCIFLIVLAIILRVLMSVKAWLDIKSLESAMKRRYVVTEGAGVEKIASDANSTTGILTTNGLAENVRVVHAPMRTIQPWRFSVDLPRAGIMTVIVGVGYLL